MKYIFLLLFCVLLFVACRSTKKDSISDTYTASKTDTQKSKYEILYYALIDSIRRVPAPKEKSETKGLQYSDLETSLSHSIAFIDPMGLLHHMLENKDTIDQPTRIIIDRQYIHDTIYIHKTDSINVNKEVYIQEEPSFWEKIRRTAGDIAIGLLVLVLVVLGIKQFIKR